MTESGPVQKLPRLQTRMLVWILGALVVVWASFVFWAYLAGVEESDELTDGHLASVAAMVMKPEPVTPAGPMLPLKACPRRVCPCPACGRTITSSR